MAWRSLLSLAMLALTEQQLKRSVIMNLLDRTQLDGTSKQPRAPWFVRYLFGILNLVLVLSITRASLTLINTFQVTSPNSDIAKLFIHQPHIHICIYIYISITIWELIFPKFTGNQDAIQLCLCILHTGFFLQESKWVENNKAISSGSALSLVYDPSLGKPWVKQ